MKSLNGAICIIAFNRMKPLLRILSNVFDSDISDLKVYVSIDYSEKQNEIISCIKSSEFYEKVEIIARERNLGLKQHVITCGDLVEKHDFIVILEDDIVLSRFPRMYIESCLQLDLRKIATISLYNYHRSEGDLCQFIPLSSGSDNYFMQYPSSWGQVYTKKMWTEFREWLLTNDCDMFLDNKLPSYICNWPKSSWKKHFLRYMVHSEKYSIYPYFSLTTNPGEDGTHHRNVRGLWLSNLLIEERNWNLKQFIDCPVVYNSHFLMENRKKNYDKNEIRVKRANDTALIHLDFLYLTFQTMFNYFHRKFTK